MLRFGKGLSARLPRKIYNNFSSNIAKYDYIAKSNVIPSVWGATAFRKFNTSLHTPGSRKKKSFESVSPSPSTKQLEEVDTSEEVPDYYDFNIQAGDLLEEIFDAIEPMLADNEPKMHLDYKPEDGKLEIIVDEGKKFTLEVMTNQNCIMFVSLVSGYKRYEYDLEVRRWVNIEDRHDLIGLLTRDLMRYTYGAPNFKV